MKCFKCDKEAVYALPCDYCAFHFHEWWYMYFTRDELIMEIAALMDKLKHYEDKGSGGLV